MKELGRVLKTARESKNLTLDEIQERTKIRKRYLQAIEEGDLSILPGLVYARGFIKNYAEILGLDGQALLREYELLEEKPVSPPANSSVDGTEPRSADVARRRMREVPRRGNRLLPQVLMGLVIIGLVGVGYWLLANREETPAPQTQQVQPPDSSQPQTPAAPATPPAEQNSGERQKPAEPLKPVTKENGKSIYKVDGPAIKLEINTENGNCWLDITADKVKKYSNLAPKGTFLKFEGTDEVIVVAGFSPALTVKVNDMPVELEQVKDRYEFRFEKK